MYPWSSHQEKHAWINCFHKFQSKTNTCQARFVENLFDSSLLSSPEHAFTAPDGKPASVSYSTTMDISIIREVFSAVLLSAEVI